MKRFLKIRKTLILTIFLVLSCIFETEVSAKSKAEYYSNLFNGWGADNNFVFDEEFLKTDNADKLKYFLSLSVDFNKLLLSSAKKGLLICDTPFRYLKNFSCNKDKVSVYIGDTIDVGKNIQIGKIQIRDKEIYIIPESLLYIPSKREEVGLFFILLYKLSNNIDTAVNKTVSYDSSHLVTHPSLFEISTYALSALILVSLLIKPLRILIKNKRTFLKKSTYIKMYKKLKDFSIQHRWLLIYILIALIMFLVPILIGVSYKDKKTFDIEYAIKFFADSINFKVFYEPQDGIFKYLMFYYSSALLCVILLLVTPYILDLVLASLNIIRNRKLNEGIGRYIIPFLLFVGVIFSVCFNINDVFVPLYLVLFSIIYLWYLILKNKKIYKYTLKEKISLLTIFILLFVIGTLYKNKHPFINSNMVEEPLLGSSSSNVYFPYSKDYGKNVLFKKYLIKPTLPLYLDYYMVYHPSFSRIENKNTSNFKDSGSYIILNSDLKDISSFLVNNFSILSKFNSELSTNFGIENLNISLNSKYELKLVFDCSKELEPAEIDIDIFYNSYKKNVDKHESEALFFPGCSKNRDSFDYTVPIDVDFNANSSVVFNLNGVPLSFFKFISFYKDDILVPTKFFNHNEDSKIFIRNIGSEDLIINYFFEDLSDKKFENKLDQSINLSEYANNLVKENLLRNPFLIWFDSDTPVMVDKVSD